jgi:hypothetical protein
VAACAAHSTRAGAFDDTPSATHDFSAAIRNPFERVGDYDTLSSLLQHRYAGPDEPVAVFLHCTCVPVSYTDRGKSMLALPYEIRRDIKDLIENVTSEWHRQRLREIKDAAQIRARRDRLVARERISIKDAAWEVMEAAYREASGGGRLPVKPRQIMYRARPTILAATGKDHLNDQYFTQTLLVDYIAGHPDQCAGWDIVWDARGNFIEPHTGVSIPLGTLEVRRYLSTSVRSDIQPHAGVDLAGGAMFPTRGPRNRFDTIQFIEKEGFGPLLQSARIAERYDVGAMSTKGMSTTAARMLIDSLAGQVNAFSYYTTSTSVVSASPGLSARPTVAIVSQTRHRSSILACASPTSKKWASNQSPSWYPAIGQDEPQRCAATVLPLTKSLSCAPAASNSTRCRRNR